MLNNVTLRAYFDGGYVKTRILFLFISLFILLLQKELKKKQRKKSIN